MPKNNRAKIKLAPRFYTGWRAIGFVLLLVGLAGWVVVSKGLFDNVSTSRLAQTECTALSSLREQVISVGDVQIVAEQAINNTEQAHGLSDRDCLADNRGMLFVYDSLESRCFWMKDMKFDIDILWLDNDRRVSYIEHDVSPGTYPKSFCHIGRYVLELGAGVAKRYDVSTGSRFVW
ncbi:DUF192 domain-containing protein [Candidatus Saccharibacteria bacterium]|nr:DUF192 domain-containing protein [Candidatus Saccharibacteria bacterium]